MKRFLRKKIVFPVIVGGLVLAMGGVAFGYFLSTGSGSGYVTVTASKGWTVQVTSDTNYDLAPGGSVEINFSITNSGGGPQLLQTATVGLVQTYAPYITDANGNNVEGCYLDWFTQPPSITFTSTYLPTDVIPANNQAYGYITVSMSEENTDQSACIGAEGPALTLNVT